MSLNIRFKNCIFIIILASVLFVSGCSEQNPWTIDGNSVYVDDSNVYINITPHTIQSSGWVNAEFESKQYEGDIDLLFGFNTEEVYPSNAQIYNPITTNETIYYTCDYDFTYTLDPNYFWCYKNYQDNQTMEWFNETIFEHWFDSGNISDATAWWHENQTTEWQNWRPDGQIDYEYEGMNLWYYAQNKHINADQLYKLRYNLEVPFNPNGTSGKYAVALKPSSETIQEAIANGHLYILDPWWDSSYAYRYPLGINFTGEGATYDDAIISVNVTNFNGSLDCLAVVIGDTYEYDWEWAHYGDNTGYNTSTNSVIRFVADNVTLTNAINNFNFTIYTPADCTSPKNVSLFPMYEDFEDGDANGWITGGSSVITTSPSTNMDGDYYANVSDPVNENVDIYYSFESQDDKLLHTGLLTLSVAGGDADTIIYGFSNTGGSSGASMRVTATSQIYQLYNESTLVTIEDIGSAIESNYHMDLTGATTQFNFTWHGLDKGEFADKGAIDTMDRFDFYTGGLNNGKLKLDDILVSIVPFRINKNSEINITTNEQKLSNIVISFVNQTPADSSVIAYNSIPVAVNITFDGTEDTVMFNLYNQSQILINSVNYTDNTRFYNFTGLSDGIYLFNVTANQTNSQNGSSDTRIVTINSVAPTLTLNSINTTALVDLTNTNITLNYSVVDVDLDVCWFNTSEHIGENHIVCNAAFLINFSTNGNKTIYYYANDSAGHLSYQNASSFIYYYDWNQSITPNQTIDIGISKSNFCLDLNTTKLPSNPVANLTWNDINLGQGTKDIVNDNEVCFTNQFTVPSNTGLSTGLLVNWSWTFSLPDIGAGTTNRSNQTVYNISFDDCTTNTFPILNLTLKEEEDRSTLSPPTPNTSIEVSLNLSSHLNGSESFAFSTNKTNVNPLGICIPNSTKDGLNNRLDVVILYEADNHASEYYYIDNFNLTNISAIPQNISLYDLSTDDSTDFKLTLAGNDSLPVEGALIYLDRQYISGGFFETVELPKTDSNGETVLHMVRNDVVYNILAIKDNGIIATLLNIRAFCADYTIGDCTIKMNGANEINEVFDYNEEVGITFTTPVYNSTLDTISFTFSSVDGTAKTVGMEVLASDAFGNRTICTNSLNSASGELSCAIDPNLSDAALGTIITVDNVKVAFLNVILDKTNYSDAGYLILFVMVLSFILMFIESKTGILIGILLGIASGFGLGLITGSLIGYGASGVWILIIVIMGIWKLNKERSQ